MENHQCGLVRRKGTDSDRVMRIVLLAVSSLAVLIVLLIILFTVGNSWLSITENGIVDFLFGDVWRPYKEEYGAFPLITGTLLVTAGAMVFAVPVGVSCAIYISEIAPANVRNLLKPMVELFSAIPSVVYGFIGMMILIPAIKTLFPDQQLFSNSWLAASLVLGIMALPTVITVSEDAIRAVPRSYREASQAMGATRWETIVKVVVPAAISGISTAIILGVGRAIGETMAVLMLTGNSPAIPDPLWNVFSLISTLTGTIALQLPESVAGSITQSALFELGVILMVMVLAINLCARHVIGRSRRRMEGRGGTPGSRPIASLLLPGCVTGFLHDNRGRIMAMGTSALLFVGVWMFTSLFANTFQSIVAALSVTGVAVLSAGLLSELGSTSRERLAFGGLRIVMGAVVLILLVIIGYILYNGLPAIDLEFLMGYPEDGGRDGGIYPAIIGTLELVAGTAAIAFPIGIVTGIYLNEYAGDTVYTRVIREAIDLLNGTPSIVFGMFGMVLFVTGSGWGYSMLAGWITLAFMVLPVIIRTTEEALRAVPRELREASRAMGATKWGTICRVVLPAAMGGVLTGTILSVGRAAGETAPIMLTAAVISSTSLAGSVFDPVMALPLHLYHLAMDVPGTTDMQYATATVLLVVVLAFFVVASLVRGHYNKKIKW